MPDSILVATDLSMRSDRALRRAGQLAVQHGATLTVLAMVDDDLPPALAERHSVAARVEIEASCADLGIEAPVIRVEIGDPLRGILAVLDELAPDLLVLGVHRDRPVWDLFHGTTMERIVRATRLPVLLVTEAPHGPYRSVLSGLDLSSASAAALTLAAELAPDAAITAFHAVHIPYQGLLVPHGTAEALAPFLDEAERALSAWWDTTPLPAACARPRPEAGGRGELLMRKFAEVSPDLLAIGAHGRVSLSPTLLGSFTEQVLRDPPCDVLVVRR